MILIINTAEQNKILVALAKANEIYQEKLEIEFHESEKLLPLIDTLLNRYNKSLKEIKEIFVVTGPGSFTSIRIGISVANTLGFSLGVPVIGLKKNEFKSIKDLISKGNKKKKTKLAYPFYGAKANITKPKKKWLK